MDDQRLSRLAWAQAVRERARAVRARRQAATAAAREERLAHLRQRFRAYLTVARGIVSRGAYWPADAPADTSHSIINALRAQEQAPAPRRKSEWAGTVVEPFAPPRAEDDYLDSLGTSANPYASQDDVGRRR